MENAAYVGLSRQAALRSEMNIIANNLANVNTPGYRGEKMVFNEFLERTTPGDRLSFVEDVGLARDLREGPINTTGNPMDVAINGLGFFAVDTPQGARYTRAGRFELNQQNQLVTADGHTLQGVGGGAITIPPEGGEISIAGDGTISNDNGVLGRIRVVGFDDERQMKRGAGGLYSTDQEPVDRPDANVMQGALEGSNVEAIMEISRMMEVLRQHQSVARFLQDDHDRQQRVIRTLGQEGGGG